MKGHGRVRREIGGAGKEARRGGDREGLAYGALMPRSSGAVKLGKNTRSTGDSWVRSRQVGLPRKSAKRSHRRERRERREEDREEREEIKGRQSTDRNEATARSDQESRKFLTHPFFFFLGLP